MPISLKIGLSSIRLCSTPGKQKLGDTVNLKALVFLNLTLVSLLSFQFAFAEDDINANVGNVSAPMQKEVAPEIKRFKAEFSSYYYNFSGTKPAYQNLYDLGTASLNIELMTLQYQATSSWTILAVGQYLVNQSVSYFGSVMSDDTTQGFGDTIISGVRPIFSQGSYLMLGDIGVSLPTGSINEKNKSVPSRNYPYVMQNGSGTVDAVLGLTNLWMRPSYQLGSHLTAYVRNAQNDYQYRLGNLYRADVWADYPIGYGFTPRLVGYYKHKDAILGQDPTEPRNQYMEYYYHPQINWDLSAALKYQHSLSQAFTVGGEVGTPLAQDSQNSDGVIVSTNYYGNLFLNGTF